MIRYLFLCATSLVLAGCGYTTGGMLPKHIHTVHVPVFDNTTFRRGLEFDLTESLKRELMARTRLRLAEREQADSILDGSIVEVRERLLAETAEEEVISKRVTVYVDFEWRDRRTGHVLASARRLSRRADMLAARGEGVLTATQESLTCLAEAIVEQMEVGW